MEAIYRDGRVEEVFGVEDDDEVVTFETDSGKYCKVKKDGRILEFAGYGQVRQVGNKIHAIPKWKPAPIEEVRF